FPVNAQAANLCIEIREVSALKERVIAEAYSWDNVARAECSLLDLREKLVDRTIKDELPNYLKGDELLGPELGSIEDIEIKLMFVLLFDDLDSEGPLWRTSILDSLNKILSVKI